MNPPTGPHIRWISLLAILYTSTTNAVFMNLPEVTSTIDNCLTSDSPFAKVANTDTFIDNTVFIKDYLEISQKMRLYIAYPRGFGKSTMLDMLRHFLEVEVDPTTATIIPPIQSQSYQFFTDSRLHLNITNNTCWVLDPGDVHLFDPGRHPFCIDEFLAKAPVIYISFRYVNGDTAEKMIQQVTQTIQRLYSKYSYLYEIRKNSSWNLDDDFSRYFNRSRWEYFGRVLHGKADRDEMSECLVFLSQLLCKFIGQKTYIFIDDYDHPFLVALQHGKVYREVYEYMDSMFIPLFHMPLPKHRIRSVESTLIMATSTLSRATESMKSHMQGLSRRCIGENSLYTENIGFFDRHVDQLFHKFNIGPEQRKQVQEYFNGYLYWDHFWSIYFPTDIVGYIKHRKIQDYRDTSNVTYQFLLNLKMKRIREKAILLLFNIEPKLTLKMDVTYEELEQFLKPVKEKTLYPEINNRNKVHNTQIVNIFFTYLFENAFIRCYKDRYVDEPAPDNCKIPNTRMHSEFQKNIETHYRTYGINLSGHPVAQHFRSMLQHENITKSMTNGLRDSLTHTFQQLRQNEKNCTQHEFVLDSEEVHSVVSLIAWYNLKNVNVSVQGLLSNIKHKNESNESIRKVRYEMLYRIKLDFIITNEDQTVMLLVKITHDQYEDEMLQKLIKYEPIYEPSTMKVYKYLLINIDVDHNIQVLSGPNRYVVTTKIKSLHRDYVDLDIED